MNTKNKYLPEKCVEVRTIGPNSACKEPAASTTGPSPYVKGGLSSISLPKLIHEFIQIIMHVNEIVRFQMHPISFGLRRASCRWLKSSTNTLFAAKSRIENSCGVNSSIGGVVAPPFDQKNWNAPHENVSKPEQLDQTLHAKNPSQDDGFFTVR